MNDAHLSSTYLRILDHLTNAVLLFNPDCRLEYINMAGEMLLSVSARQVTGMRFAELFLLQEQDLEKDLRQTLQHGVSLIRRNLSIGSPTHPITVNVTMTPMHEHEPPVGVVVEIEQVDRHIRISMEEQLLAQHNAARMLLRGLAHEIKNPLGGLRGAAQLLDRELMDAELREYTRIIMEESDRLQSLVDRMLAPNKPPRKNPLNIHRVLERVRQLVQVEAPAGVIIERDYDPSIPLFNGDSDQLIQAILNIVRNAAQAVGQQGTITLRTRIHRQVTIGFRRNRIAARIEIVDNGPGIKPELLGQIFYPMVTGRADGTGLGLSIAQSLINQHGGLVECASVPGNTVFSIFLPLETEYD